MVNAPLSRLILQSLSGSTGLLQPVTNGSGAGTARAEETSSNTAIIYIERLIAFTSEGNKQIKAKEER
jgi:hypothetical protein